MSLVRLRDVFAGSPDRAVCIDDAHVITLGEFRARVAMLVTHFEAMHEARFALCIADAYDFACALFALLAAAKGVSIPANAARGHLATLADSFDVVLHELPPAEPADACKPIVIPADASFVMYTSGSSGKPKAVRKWIHEIDAELDALETQWSTHLDDARVLGCVPHHHFYGLVFQILWPLAAGRAFDRAKYAQPIDLARRMSTERPTAIVASPAHLAIWSRMPGFDALSSARMFSAGGVLRADVARPYIELLGAAPTEIYGCTEAGALAWRRQDQHASWTVLPGVEVTQHDDASLIVRASSRGDSLHTQDAVSFDSDGRFHLLGRMDRIIKIDDKRVSLTEIETRLAEHAFVRQAAVVKLSNEKAPRRDRLGAVIELSKAGSQAWIDHGRLAMTRQLTHFLSEHFSVIPRRWRFRASMPFDERGKLPAEVLQREFEVAEDRPEVFAEVVDGKRVHFDLHVPATLIHFAGHFPALPILPGVVQVDWAIRFAARHMNCAPQVATVQRLKFMTPVRPDAMLSLVLECDHEQSRVRFDYRLGGRACASGVIVFRSIAA
jgi:acyl-CoA synthetase (AMP-forming)/AMP-acid ligase II/3-hydroxymyristoyl/3-hydroxydecanoyl-(acyl carrier protein) dehydratase